MKKAITLLLLSILIISSLSIPIMAAAMTSDNEILPRWNNTNTCKTNFTITESGTAQVLVQYQGIPDVTTNVETRVQLEKKVLGLFWSKVDIGEPNDEWIVISSNINDTIVHTTHLNKKGTYRAVFEVTFSGSNGPDDVVEIKTEAKYE